MKRLGVSPLDIAGLTLLLALIAGLTIWLASLIGGAEAERIGPLPWQPSRDPATLFNPPPPHQKTAFKHTFERPIFSESRRPYLAPPAPPSPKAAQLVTPPPPPLTAPAIRLAGIAIVGGARQAFLISPEKADGAWTREGETMSGWKVSGITAETVTVEQSGRSFEFHLYETLVQDEIASGAQARPNLR